MNKIIKILVLVLAMVFGIGLVGCKKTDDPIIAPTAITVDATIYSGDESSKYVVVGSQMYIEAQIEGEEGADETVKWSIDGDCATLSEEDGTAVITGVKAGNVTVTATSAVDASISGSYVAEVVDSEDFNAAVVAAKDYIVANLPVYTAADFTLPQPENPNIKVTYMSKLKKVWADGVFKYSDAYKASAGDITYVFYANISFHGVKKEFDLSVKCVGDSIDNDFYALSAAKAKVEKMFENKNISSEFTGIIANADGSYSIDLPISTTVEGCSQTINIEWAVESGSGISVKNTIDADGNVIKAELVYIKPLVDSTCQVNAIYKASSNNEISKFFLTAVGYTPDEVWTYFKTNGLKKIYDATTDTFVSSTAGFTAPTTDTTKKFKLLTVEYKVADASADLLLYTAPTGTSTNGTFRKKAAGTAQVEVTLYYNKTERTVMVDTFDESGNLVKDADGNVVQHEEIQIVSDWTKTYTIELTLK